MNPGRSGGTTRPRWRPQSPPRNLAAAFAGILLVLSAAPIPARAASGPPHEPLLVRETGLPAGRVNWTLTISSPTEHGTRYTCSNTTFVDSEQPGPVTITIFPAGLYQPSPAFGSVTVFGSPVTFNTTFTENTSIIQPPNDSGGAAPATTFGLSSSQLEFLVVVAIVVAVASLLVFRIRRPPARRALDEAATPPKRKRGKPTADNEEAKPEDPDAVERRRARRERREGVARDRSRGRPRPEAKAASVDDEDDA